MQPERMWALSPFAKCHELSEMNKSSPTSSRDGADQDQFLTILSREEALARFEAALFPRDPAVAECALSDALGLALARDVVAAMDVPPFDRSNVDGFAVRSSDLAAAGEASLPAAVPAPRERQASRPSSAPSMRGGPPRANRLAIVRIAFASFRGCGSERTRYLCPEAFEG